MIQFKTVYKLINAKFATKNNINKIYAISSRLCTNVHGYGIDPKTYYEKWVIKKEPQGYIFREITHNGGISGHHPTVKRCVMMATGSHLKVVFDDKEIAS